MIGFDKHQGRGIVYSPVERVKFLQIEEALCVKLFKKGIAKKSTYDK